LPSEGRTSEGIGGSGDEMSMRMRNDIRYKEEIQEREDSRK
jgi:hypothetical protein